MTSPGQPKSIRDHLIKKLGQFRESSSSNEILFCCPFCHTIAAKIRRRSPDTGYKLTINIGKWVYHCYRCKVNGQLSDLLPSGERHTIRKAVAEAKRDKPSRVLKPRRGINGTSRIVSGSKEWKWLEGRGVDPRKDWNGDPWPEGLFLRTPDYPKRIIFAFPESDYWQAYAIEKWMEPKTLNEVGQKIVYNPRVLGDEKELWLVEGLMDCLSTPNSVASMGMSLSSGVIKQLRRIGFQKLVVCWDGGEIQATAIAVFKLMRAFDKSRIYFCLLPPGKDPNDLGPKYMLGTAKMFVYPATRLTQIRKLAVAP